MTSFVPKPKKVQSKCHTLSVMVAYRQAWESFNISFHRTFGKQRVVPLPQSMATGPTTPQGTDFGVRGLSLGQRARFSDTTASGAEKCLGKQTRFTTCLHIYLTEWEREQDCVYSLFCAVTENRKGKIHFYHIS